MKKQPTVEIIEKEKFAERLQLKGFASTTREKIVRAAERFAAWCNEQNVPLQEVSYNDVMAYIAHCKEQRNNQRTQQIIVGQLKHYYSFLLDEQIVADNPCTNIEIRGVKRKHLYDTFTREELDTIYRTYAATPAAVSGAGNHIAHRRNKVMLGLLIYQGLATHELADLELKNLNLKEGKITIGGTRRTEGRELKLEAHQVYELMDYVNETRKMILALTGKETQKLFTSVGAGQNINNLMQPLIRQLQKQQPRLKDIKQLRASVITSWLKEHNIRKVQYMAGHRYVSSTESYKANDMDELKTDISKYHPNL